MKLKVKKLQKDAIIPKYQTAGAAGFDLHAAMESTNVDGQTVYNQIYIPSGESKIVPTGLSVEVPEGYELQVRSRSGLASKNKVTVLNSPGTVDSDYRGPLGVILYNGGPTAFWISHGDRIAQGVIAPVVQVDFEEAEELSDTVRGSGGFGSTKV